jgi:hypothetical protein
MIGCAERLIFKLEKLYNTIKRENQEKVTVEVFENCQYGRYLFADNVSARSNGNQHAVLIFQLHAGYGNRLSRAHYESG